MVEEKQESITKEELKESKPDDKIDRANAAAQRMEEAGDKLKAENDRTEALAVERKLSGKAEAGTEAPEEKKETSPADYAKEVVAGEHNDPRKED